MDLIYQIYNNKRNVFRLKDVAMLSGETNLISLSKSLNYFVHNGKLLNPRNGIDSIEQIKQTQLLDGLGELISLELKPFVKNKLKNEVITLLRFYREFPIER